jgi:uncharacterized protein (TIGR01777 family)
VPFQENAELISLLDEMALTEGNDADGNVLIKEQFLCRDPEERVFYKGRWYQGLYLATQWENAFAAHPTPRTRRVTLRMSFVLGREGGVFRMLAMLTKCFLGGRVGTGRQFMSWIHIDDLVRIVQRAIDDESMEGLYIASGPNPLRNVDFMREMRRAFHRPWSPPATATMVKFGCFILRTEPVLALTGRRAQPKRLLDAGFEFHHTDLRDVLATLV